MSPGLHRKIRWHQSLNILNISNAMDVMVLLWQPCCHLLPQLRRLKPAPPGAASRQNRQRGQQLPSGCTFQTSGGTTAAPLPSAQGDRWKNRGTFEASPWARPSRWSRSRPARSDGWMPHILAKILWVI